MRPAASTNCDQIGWDKFTILKKFYIISLYDIPLDYTNSFAVGFSSYFTIIMWSAIYYDRKTKNYSQ